MFPNNEEPTRVEQYKLLPIKSRSYSIKVQFLKGLTKLHKHFAIKLPLALSSLVLPYALKPSPARNPDSNFQAINTASVQGSQRLC